MGDVRKLNKVLEAVAWGSLFIWWGLALLLHWLPNGVDAAGTGLILLGVNLVRLLKGIPVNGFSSTLGILALAWGALDLSRSVFHLPFRLPVFEILMILLGVILLTASLRRGVSRTGDLDSRSQR